MRLSELSTGFRAIPHFAIRLKRIEIRPYWGYFPRTFCICNIFSVCKFIGTLRKRGNVDQTANPCPISGHASILPAGVRRRPDILRVHNTAPIIAEYPDHPPCFFRILITPDPLRFVIPYFPTYVA